MLLCQMSVDSTLHVLFKIILRMETLGALKMKSVSLVAVTFLSVLLPGISSFEAQCIANYVAISNTSVKIFSLCNVLLSLLNVLL